MNATTMHLREINIDTVRRLLRDAGSATKNSLAENTGLSVASCGNVITTLLKTGEIREISPGESTGGRPSRRFEYNFDFAHFATVYLRKEGSSAIMHSTVMNLAGESLRDNSIELSDNPLADIESILKMYCSDVPTIRSAAIGIPGVVHNGEIGICDLPELTGVPLVSRLEKRLGIPVAAENDVNLAALGNHFRRTGNESENSVCLYYPQGGNPGAGIVVGGKVLKGHSNFAGEVSYLPLGVSLEDQGALSSSPELFLEFVSNTIQSLISIVNPQNIRLIGLDFTDDSVSGIQEILRAVIPQVHIPEILFDPDIHDFLAEGLNLLAIGELDSGVQLVNTRENSGCRL